MQSSSEHLCISTSVGKQKLRSDPYFFWRLFNYSHCICKNTITYNCSSAFHLFSDWSGRLVWNCSFSTVWFHLLLWEEIQGRQGFCWIHLTLPLESVRWVNLEALFSTELFLSYFCLHIQKMGLQQKLVRMVSAYAVTPGKTQKLF